MIHINRHTGVTRTHALAIARKVILMAMSLCVIGCVSIPKDSDGVPLEPFAVYGDYHLYPDGTGTTNRLRVPAFKVKWKFTKNNELVIEVFNIYGFSTGDQRFISNDNWNTIIASNGVWKDRLSIPFLEGDPTVFGKLEFNNLPDWTKEFITEQKRWVSVANTIQDTGTDIPPTTESEKAFGRDHPSVAGSLNNLAGLYRTQGQYAQAEPLYKRSLAILEKALGPDHPSVAMSLENMAALYRKTDRKGEAEALEKRAAAIRAIRR